MKYAQEHGADLGGLARTARVRGIKRFRAVLGLKYWPQDILRHTAASMMLAHRQDAGYVAKQLGNSPGILMRHYMEIVERDVAEKFWALTPDKVLAS